MHLCILVHEFMGVGVCTHLWICIWRPEMDIGLFLNPPPLGVLRQSLTEPEA